MLLCFDINRELTVQMQLKYYDAELIGLEDENLNNFPL